MRLKIPGNPSGQIYSAITKNISQCGICLEIQHKEETLRKSLSDAHQKVSIDINALIPQQQNADADLSVWVNGRVDWTRESDQTQSKLQVGLEFEDLTEDARRRIRDYLVNQFLQHYPKIN